MLTPFNPRHRRSPKNLQLNDVFPEWAGQEGGFFLQMENLVNAFPWSAKVPASYLDASYHGAHSGEKFVSPLVYNFLNTEGELTSSGFAHIAFAVQSVYWQKWNHIWSLYESRYNPLDTYTYTEESTRTISDEGNNEVTKAATDTLRHSGTDTEQSSGSVNRTTESERSAELGGSDVASTAHGHEINVNELGTSSLTHGLTVTDSGEEEKSLAHGLSISESGDESSTTDHDSTVTDAGNPSETNTGKVKGFNSQTFADSDQTVKQITTDNTQVTDETTTTVTDFSKSIINSGTDTDTTTFGKVVTNSGTDSSQNSVDRTEAHSGTDSETTTYGKTESETNESTDTETNSKTNTRTLNLTDSDTANEHTTEESANTRTDEYSATKTGNMYRSPAELLSMDRDFWLTEFFSIVFEDVDKMLTLGIYSERTPNTKFF